MPSSARLSRLFRCVVRSGMLALLGGACVASAQQPLHTLLVDVDHRPATSLDGNWHYLVDMTGRGLYTESGEVRDNGYALNEHPNLTGEHRVQEYDFATAPTLKVPGDWNTQDPTLFRYEGVLWYERDFNFQPRPGMRTFLHIGAANYRSHVWVNQKRICDHEGGFTPFDCEVTSVLHPGNNFVVIAVDSTRLKDGIPSVISDWYNYGGLTRDVSLVEVPQAFIDDFDLHLKRGTTDETVGDEITGYVHVESGTPGMPVTVRIPEAGIDATATTDANGRAEFDLHAKNLSLWEPGNPKLYKVEMVAGQDHLTDDMGFRDIRVEGTRILLNGKPIFLYGVNAHAEAPYRTGRADSDQDVANIFGFLKDLHANFVRLCHYPQDERMERMADRDGIMIWSEIPVWQHISFDNPETYAKADAMLHEMIRRDRDKASVIMWSVSNETPNNPVRTEFLTNLANEARTLDPTRPITSALNTARLHGTEMTLDDPLVKALDIVGVNEYIGWYQGLPQDADKITWNLPQKPILISEFGAEAKAGNHGPKDQRWTEEYQVDFYKHNFAMLSHIPQIRGYVPWVLMDFRSPTRNLPRLQDGFNRKGLISEDGKKKLAFDFMQNVYENHTYGKAQ